MNLKKIIVSLTLGAITATALAVTASAATTEYGKAGIVWMIKDEWEHRNSVGLQPFDELGKNVIGCTMTDVNVTGNGQYEVSMEGWAVAEADREFVTVGNYGVDLAVDFIKYKDVKIVINEYTMDGKTYKVKNEYEIENNATNSDNMCVKLINPYGNIDDRGLKYVPWSSTDKMTIKFTISGLPGNKLAKNPNESIVNVYTAGPVGGTDSSTTSKTDSTTVATTEKTTVSTTVSSSSSSATDSSSSKVESSDSDGDSKTLIYICSAVGGVVLLAIIIALIAKKKK